MTLARIHDQLDITGGQLGYAEAGRGRFIDAEPGTLAMLTTGLLGLGFARRQRRAS